MIFYNDPCATIYKGNCLDILPGLPEASVQMVVTSPPYWSLRKYEGEQVVEPWGCAYGLEPTPELYVEHTVEILAAIRRVLRKDGVVFWNLGDSYNGSGGDHKAGGKNDASFQTDLLHGTRERKVSNLKPKDLCLIPFRVAIAAQSDSWWVRSIIIWNKPNPMPESVRDRPTNSHEYILMLTKSERYYWDQEATREKSTDSESLSGHRHRNPQKINAIDPEHAKTRAFQNIENGKTYPTRNLRSVWTFPTQPYPAAHFAVFPRELPRKCIMAASKQGDIVLDPFGGSGTVGEVAKSLGRKSILIELSAEYCKLAIQRVEKAKVPMF